MTDVRSDADEFNNILAGMLCRERLRYFPVSYGKKGAKVTLLRDSGFTDKVTIRITCSGGIATFATDIHLTRSAYRRIRSGELPIFDDATELHRFGRRLRITRTQDYSDLGSVGQDTIGNGLTLSLAEVEIWMVYGGYEKLSDMCPGMDDAVAVPKAAGETE